MPGVVRQAYCTGSFVTRTSSHRPSIVRTVVGGKRILRVDVQPPEQGGGALLEQDAPIAHVTARTGPLHRQGIAIQGQADVQALRLSQQSRQQNVIAPFGHQHVRVVHAQQALESLRGGLVGIIEHLPVVFNGHLDGAVPAVLGVDVGNPFQANPHGAHGRPLIFGPPLIVAADDGMDFRRDVGPNAFGPGPALL